MDLRRENRNLYALRERKGRVIRGRGKEGDRPDIMNEGTRILRRVLESFESVSDSILREGHARDQGDDIQARVTFSTGGGHKSPGKKKYQKEFKMGTPTQTASENPTLRGGLRKSGEKDIRKRAGESPRQYLEMKKEGTNREELRPSPGIHR